MISVTNDYVYFCPDSKPPTILEDKEYPDWVFELSEKVLYL
jgi:hypothetical protein